MLPEWILVGFSGHRELAAPEKAAKGIREALDRLAANHGPFATVSSAASGADTLFVEEAARRHWPYLLLLPFPKSRFEKDFSPSEWQRILPFIENATRVEEASDEASDEAAYMETGVQTVDRAEVILAVWDGKPAAGLGGTGDVVSYARELGKPLILIDPITGNTSEERLEQLPAKSAPIEGSQSLRGAVEEHFRSLDEQAETHAPKSRHLLLRIILFQLLASATGLTVLAFGNHEHKGLLHPLSTATELILLGMAFFWALQHRRKSHEWVTHRIDAEICRSFLAMWDIPRRADHFPNLSIKICQQLCRSLRLMRLMDKTSSSPFEVVRDRYLKERVEDQIRFFSVKGKLARENFQRLRSLMLGTTAVAALCSLIALVLASCEVIGLPLLIPKYLSLLLPLASTAFFLLVVTQDYSRRAVRYNEMVEALENAEKRLKHARTWSSLARVAAETEEQLLQEVIEWHSFRRFAGEPN